MTLPLSAGQARATLAPDQGGALATLTVAGRPVLSTGAGRPAGHAFALGMQLLLPFSNRISGPFPVPGGGTVTLEPNAPPEPFPIHGDAWSRPWAVTRQDATSATLHLAEGRFGPFAYEAEATYALAPGRLDATVTLTSRADATLPFGMGFHPWFPRSPATRMRFRATGHWPQDDRYIPVTDAPVPPPPGWDWSSPAPPPEGWINTGFSGWDGTADLLQGEDGVSVRIEAPGCADLMVYSPSAASPFLCLEPVSHPVDAHTRPGQPGLVPLGPGDRMTRSLALIWSDQETVPGSGPHP